MRYYTIVRFPKAALAIDEIREAFENPGAGQEAFEDGFTPGLLVYVDQEARWGDIDEITEPLEDHRVPYDHYHSESEGSDGGAWTEHIRWSGGNRIETYSDDALDDALDNAVAQAAELKRMLDAGDLKGLRRALDDTLAKDAPALEDLGWQPT